MSLKKLLDLSGKVALVTGGSRGLGLQAAEALGKQPVAAHRFIEPGRHHDHRHCARHDHPGSRRRDPIQALP